MVRQPARPPSQRQLRVGEEVRHAIALAFERGELHDPDLEGQTLTVTEVRVSPDLKNATAFVLPLGGADCGPAIAALNKASGFVRHWVGQNVRLRYVPKISFTADTSFDEAGRIDAVLHDPRVRRDLDADPDDTD